MLNGINAIDTRPFSPSAARFRRAISSISSSAGGLSRNLDDIKSAENESAQVSAFSDMARSFNSLISKARRASSRGNNLLTQGLAELAQSSASELRRIGITVRQDGSLRVDNGRMQTAAERGDIDRFVRENRQGNAFISGLSSMADMARRSPEAFFS